MNRRAHQVSLLLCLAVVALTAACRGPQDSGEQAGRVGQVRIGAGVTERPCPEAVDRGRGCIFLGTISDLTVGPFTAQGIPVTRGQQAFWRRVNEQGGIGGRFDVDVTSHVRDNQYNPQVHSQAYQEIKGSVLALAQTFGSPTTAAILDDLTADGMVAAPASWTSAWLFQRNILESGASYCIEAMNAVDYAAAERQARSVMAVHFPGDYGDDAAAGAEAAAEARRLPFAGIEQTPPSPQAPADVTGALDAIVRQRPDLVLLAVSPSVTNDLVGQAAARGYAGLFIGTGPSWEPGLLTGPAGAAVSAQFLRSSASSGWGADSAGHRAMRAAVADLNLPDFRPHDGYAAGWIWSYPLKAALERAAANGDLTRRGVLTAIGQLERIDYEGMLPPGASYTGGPNEQAFRQSIIARPDRTAPTGLSQVKPFFTGPTAEAFDFGDRPCFQR